MMAESLDSRPRILTIEKHGVQTDGQSSPNKVKGPMAPIKRGPLKVDQYGEASYKNTPSETLKRSIQLGLQVSIGALEPKPKRDLLMTDFEVEELVNFPGDGSVNTPAHNFSSFKFKTYSPIAFRFFRDAFGIAPQDFMLALCDKPLVDLSNPGASGSLFYLSTNDEFIMKTVQRKEAEFLQKLLPGYYLNLTQNRYTLLPKFFGLYKYQSGGTNIRIVAMNNLLPRNYVYHEKFDLKGSTFKRRASPEEREKKSPTFKDLDFVQMHPEGFTLSPEHYDAVSDSLSRDVKVLESFSIMDYSLLLGIHYLEKDVEQSVALAQSLDIVAGVEQGDDYEEARRRRATFSILSKDRKPIVRKRVDEDPSGQQAVGIVQEGIPAHTVDGRKVLLFMGIIDILQSYRLKKRLEHRLKAIYADGTAISVCHPHDYSQRFLNFLTTQVFRKGKAKSKPRRLSVKANKKPMPVVVTERVPVKTGDTPDSVPPSYNEVLEKDKNNKSKPTSVESPLASTLSDPSVTLNSQSESNEQPVDRQEECTDPPQPERNVTSTDGTVMTVEPTEPKQPSKDATQPSQVGTQPSGNNTQTSEVSTRPSGDSTQTSEVSTQPSGDNTQTSEVSTQPSGDNTQTSEGSTQPSGDSTQTSQGSTHVLAEHTLRLEEDDDKPEFLNQEV